MAADVLIKMLNLSARPRPAEACTLEYLNDLGGRLTNPFYSRTYGERHLLEPAIMFGVASRVIGTQLPVGDLATRPLESFIEALNVLHDRCEFAESRHLIAASTRWLKTTHF